MTMTETTELPQRGPLELRAVTETLDVDFPERRIRLIVMPYNQQAVVAYRGRPILETCQPGAFEGIERRHRPPRAFRDHDRRAVFGHAAALDGNDQRGLIADIEVSPTPLGDETLTLAQAGDLDASAGFNVLRGGERWTSDRQQRTLTKLWLDHIALTADPAYPGAQVLDVRHVEMLNGLPPYGEAHGAISLSSDPDLPIELDLPAIEVPAMELAVVTSSTPRKDGLLAKVAELRSKRAAMFPVEDFDEWSGTAADVRARVDELRARREEMFPLQGYEEYHPDL